MSLSVTIDYVLLNKTYDSLQSSSASKVAGHTCCQSKGMSTHSHLCRVSWPYFIIVLTDVLQVGLYVVMSPCLGCVGLQFIMR